MLFHDPPIIPGRPHFYFMAGICDLTTKMSGFRYQEVIVTEAERKLENFKIDLENVQDKVLRMGALPVFCTIPTLHLATWNSLRLKQKKTTVLNFKSDYASMQNELNDVIHKANYHLVELNKSNDLSTPLIHTIMQKRKGNNT